MQKRILSSCIRLTLEPERSIYINLHSQVSSTSAQRAEFKHSCSMVKMKFQAPLWTTELGAQNPVCYFTCLRRAMIWQLLCNTAVRLGCLQVVRSRFPLSRSRPLQRNEVRS